MHTLSFFVNYIVIYTVVVVVLFVITSTRTYIPFGHGIYPRAFQVKPRTGTGTGTGAVLFSIQPLDPLSSQFYVFSMTSMWFSL